MLYQKKETKTKWRKKQSSVCIEFLCKCLLDKTKNIHKLFHKKREYRQKFTKVICETWYHRKYLCFYLFFILCFLRHSYFFIFKKIYISLEILSLFPFKKFYITQIVSIFTMQIVFLGLIEAPTQFSFLDIKNGPKSVLNWKNSLL